MPSLGDLWLASSGSWEAWSGGFVFADSPLHLCMRVSDFLSLLHGVFFSTFPSKVISALEGSVKAWVCPWFERWFLCRLGLYHLIQLASFPRLLSRTEGSSYPGPVVIHSVFSAARTGVKPFWTVVGTRDTQSTQQLVGWGHQSILILDQSWLSMPGQVSPPQTASVSALLLGLPRFSNTRSLLEAGIPQMIGRQWFAYFLVGLLAYDTWYILMQLLRDFIDYEESPEIPGVSLPIQWVWLEFLPSLLVMAGI